MNVEAAIWAWIYMGMLVGVIAVAILIFAIIYENKE